MKFILGKKLDMTQVWKGDEMIAVTRVQAGPCTVVQIKNDEKDGYNSIQIGYGKRKEKNIAKPQKGHMKDLGNMRYLREFRIKTEDEKSKLDSLKKSDKIDVSTFEVGDNIQVTGISKGKGFQGVVKRHGFKGASATHGTKDQHRMPGSIGATGPAHVFKGQKMPGRMGGDQTTVKNLEVIKIDIENNVMFVSGAVPGARNGLILIQGEGDLKIVKVEEKKSEDIKIETTENTKGEGSDEKIKNKEELETPEKVEKEVVEAKEKVEEKNKEEVKTK